MSQLVWIEDYSVHIRSIDNEHKLLIGYFNDIVKAIDMETRAEFRRQLIIAYLSQLQKLFVAHFESEERFMVLNKYEETESHKSEHSKMISNLNNFVDEFKNGTREFDDGLTFIMKDWVVRHIILYDSKFGNYFKERTDLIG